MRGVENDLAGVLVGGEDLVLPAWEIAALLASQAEGRAALAPPAPVEPRGVVTGASTSNDQGGQQAGSGPVKPHSPGAITRPSARRAALL